MNIKLDLCIPSRLSSLCSSSDIPKVVTTNACVSPLVNKADPCVLGSTPTSFNLSYIGKTSSINTFLSF